MYYCTECGLPLMENEGIITRHGRFCCHAHANSAARLIQWNRSKQLIDEPKRQDAEILYA